MWLVTVADGESVASCGSRVTASVPWATTSVCARAEADRAPAASSVTVRRRLFLSMCTPLVTAGHQIQDWMQYGPPTGPVPVRQLADSSLWTSWYGRHRLRSTDGHVGSWDGQVNNARSRGLPALFWRFPLVMAEREGFEPSMQETHIHAFQACSLNHSDTSPRAALKGFGGKGKSTSRCRPGSTSCRRRPGGRPRVQSVGTTAKELPDYVQGSSKKPDHPGGRPGDPGQLPDERGFQGRHLPQDDAGFRQPAGTAGIPGGPDGRPDPGRGVASGQQPGQRTDRHPP